MEPIQNNFFQNNNFNPNQIPINNPFFFNNPYADNNTFLFNNINNQNMNMNINNNPFLFNNINNQNMNMNNNPFLFNNKNMNNINMNNNNLFLNQNFMNNQNQMMQMNQMMMGNLNNQYNQYNFINQNQKNLVDKIIQFYQRSGRKFMNYNEKNQISNLLDNLDTNSPKLKEGNDIADPLPYIKEKKKLIKFINHDFKIFNVKVPTSIDKMTLYQIADMYKSWHVSGFLLVYMNCILNEDESSIESISEGDFVIIIEDIYYLDNTYLNLLTDKNYIGEKINVQINFHNGHIRNYIIPSNTKYSQFYKALTFNFGCQYIFTCNGQKMNENNDQLIGGLLPILPIECIGCWGSAISGSVRVFGKKITLKIKNLCEIPECDVGVLSSVKRFLEFCRNVIGQRVKGFYFDNKELYFEEDRSFASLGINNDSEITLIFDKR